MGTNNDLNLNETPLVLLACLAFVRLAPALKTRVELRRILVTAVLASMFCLALTGVWTAVTRDRIRSIGPGMFYEQTSLTPTGGPPYLAGMLTGPAFKSMLTDVQQVLAMNPSLTGSGDSVFFGPRLLEMYPEFGLSPQKALPTWWQLYPDGDPRTDDLVRTFAAERPTLCVFIRDNYTYQNYPYDPVQFYPSELRQAFPMLYHAYTWHTLTLCVRNGATVTLPAGALQTY